MQKNENNLAIHPPTNASLLEGDFSRTFVKIGYDSQGISNGNGIYMRSASDGSTHLYIDASGIRSDNNSPDYVFTTDGQQRGMFFLPISGGTMDGNITFLNGSIQFNNSLGSELTSHQLSIGEDDSVATLQGDHLSLEDGPQNKIEIIPSGILINNKTSNDLLHANGGSVNINDIAATIGEGYIPTSGGTISGGISGTSFDGTGFYLTAYDPDGNPEMYQMYNAIKISANKRGMGAIIELTTHGVVFQDNFQDAILLNNEPYATNITDEELEEILVI